MTPLTKKLSLIGLFALVFGAMVGVLTHFELLSLQSVVDAYEKTQAFYAERPVLFVSLYFITYIIMAAFSVPGASLFSLYGSAVMGFGVGLVVISFASSLGATFAMLIARTIARDWVRDRFPSAYESVNRGVESEGRFYLFALRLVPLFPFFLVNLVSGLTRLRTWDFYWVSQLGMLSGTVVYVNAGSQLGKIQSLGEIVSWKILVSFSLLGLLPLVGRWLLKVLRKKKYSSPT